jgi:hypothetical protein
MWHENLIYHYDILVIARVPQMLREGKSRSCGEWPAAVPETSKNKPSAGGRHNSDSEPEPEGYVPAPTFSQSFSDAIALALKKAVANKESPKGKLSPLRCWV